MSGGGGPILWTDFRTVLHMTALQCNLDPDRLLPHSNRAGANMHLEDFDDSVKMAQGAKLVLPPWHALVRSRLTATRQ